MDPLQHFREHRLLPSDLLRMAQQNNPGLDIALDFPNQDVREPTPVASVVVLRVVTERGTVEYDRRPGERWLDVFRRAGLLRR